MRAGRILGAVYGRLSGSGARSAVVRAGIRLSASRRPTLYPDGPPARRVLAIAPHMDDEVLGCGGALRKHVLAGAGVTVAYLTDGRRGDPALNEASLPAAERRAREETLVALRKEEARGAAGLLGIRELVFMDRPDGALSADRPLLDDLRGLLRRVRPDIVYLPFLTDRHPDHWEANRALVEAAAPMGADFLCAGTEIWSPLCANALVDISDVVEDKRRAIARFESQLRHTDYLNAILSLNAYRAMVHLKGRGHAEALYLAPLRDYARLYGDMIAVRRGRDDDDPAHS